MGELSPGNQTILTIGLVALGVYFTAVLAMGLAGFARYWRLRHTAVLTWPSPRPAHYRAFVALGVVAALVAVVNIAVGRPLVHVWGQVVMAAYFTVMVPLARRIPLGLYEAGIWADDGFVPYGRISRMAFRETPRLVLLLLPRGRSGSVRLPVPPDEYGAVRKLLGDKVRAHGLTADPPILGLAD